MSLRQPRTLAYWQLRCCERLGMSERAFRAAAFEDQAKWLAYALVREAEENAWGEGWI